MSTFDSGMQWSVEFDSYFEDDCIWCGCTDLRGQLGDVIKEPALLAFAW